MTTIAAQTKMFGNAVTMTAVPNLVVNGILNPVEAEMIMNTFWDRIQTTIRDWGNDDGAKLWNPSVRVRVVPRGVLVDLLVDVNPDGMQQMQWFASGFNISGLRTNTFKAVAVQMANWIKDDFGSQIVVSESSYEIEKAD